LFHRPFVAEYLTRDAIESGWDGRTWSLYSPTWMRKDEMEQAQIDEILLRNGVVTVNEVRRARGLAEII